MLHWLKLIPVTLCAFLLTAAVQIPNWDAGKATLYLLSAVMVIASWICHIAERNTSEQQLKKLTRDIANLQQEVTHLRNLPPVIPQAIRTFMLSHQSSGSLSLPPPYGPPTALPPLVAARHSNSPVVV